MQLRPLRCSPAEQGHRAVPLFFFVRQFFLTWEADGRAVRQRSTRARDRERVVAGRSRGARRDGKHEKARVDTTPSGVRAKDPKVGTAKWLSR